MATSSLIALGLSIVAVISVVVGLYFLNLGIGAFETYFGKPQITFLKSERGGSSFAFAFKWNSAKEEAALDYVKIRLFNPFGKPTQVEVTRSFDKKNSSFVLDVNLGSGYLDLLSSTNFENARLTIEVGSTKDGVVFPFEMSGRKFKRLLAEAQDQKAKFEAQFSSTNSQSKSPIEIPERSFIANSVEAAPQVALALQNNPAFSAYFAQFGGGGAGGAAGSGAGAAAQANFTVAKVWIEPGCIICNACQDIYPEVFDVQPDTCYIRPNAPLDNGLLIQEAAEACPVEVIKYTKAG
jgi:ferredoxin